MASNVQLDPETEVIVERLARRKAQSQSEIVRQAVELLAAWDRETPYDRVADLIGCVSGGPPELSEETGKKFRQILARKENAPH